MFYKKSDEGYTEPVDGIRFKSLTHGEKTHLVEFRLAKGMLLPEHSHHHEQIGYLVSGGLLFNVNGERFEAGPGDSWSIKGELPHSAEALDDCVVVEVFSPVREDYLP